MKNTPEYKNRMFAALENKIDGPQYKMENADRGRDPNAGLNAGGQKQQTKASGVA